jgi:dienelactone hydrolase
MDWAKTHGQAQTRPPLDKVIAELKKQGVKEFGAIGYCFGGAYNTSASNDNSDLQNIL